MPEIVVGEVGCHACGASAMRTTMYHVRAANLARQIEKVILTHHLVESTTK